MNRTGFCIYINTVGEGPVPLWRDGDGKPPLPLFSAPGCQASLCFSSCAGRSLERRRTGCRTLLRFTWDLCRDVWTPQRRPVILSAANGKLEKALGVAHRHKTTEVICEVKRCHGTADQLLKTVSMANRR
jgi:hypothetical protein